MTKTLALIGITAAVVAVLLLHMLMSRKGPVWLGAVFPLVWIVGVVVLLVQGQLTSGHDYLVAAAGLVMLLWLWGSARTPKKDEEGPRQ